MKLKALIVWLVHLYIVLWLPKELLWKVQISIIILMELSLIEFMITKLNGLFKIIWSYLWYLSY